MQEVVRNYHRNEGLPRCAIKIDIMKAYDSVDWSFQFEVMGFPLKFTSWIRQCVTKASFSVSY